MRKRLLTFAVAAPFLMAACGRADTASTELVRTALADTTSAGPAATTAVAAAPTTSSTGCGSAWKPTESFAPDPGPPPGPVDFVPGSTMQQIRDVGYVTIGVDENTVPLASRSGSEFEGFEIDLAHLVTEALTGTPEAVRFKTVTTDQKTRYVESGDVDLAIDAISMTCKRWQKVLFSQPYYEAEQRVMVRRDSDIDTMAELNDSRVCVTAGSTSSAEVEQIAPDAVQVPVETRTECLIALERGTADWLFTHDTFLYGFLLNDPTVQVILPEVSSPTTYGIAVPQGHEDLVRFLNAKLEQWRTDGTLDELARKWFTPPAGTDVGDLDVLRPIPAPTYRPEP